MYAVYKIHYSMFKLLERVIAHNCGHPYGGSSCVSVSAFSKLFHRRHFHCHSGRHHLPPANLVPLILSNRTQRTVC